VTTYAPSTADQLDLLLAEPVDAAERREATAFAEAAGASAERIVLLGSGGLGRRFQRGLRAGGVEPLAFADNNPARWGGTIDGTPVLSPEQAVARFADAAFVVTIWGAGSPHRFEHSETQLHQLGARIVRPAAELAWAYAGHVLPHYAMDLPSRLLRQAADVRRAFDLLADDRSGYEYLEQVRFRLTGDPSGLPRKDAGLHYLQPDLVRPIAGEVLLDCGAYDGDTLVSWLAERGPDFAEWVALEPDRASRERLLTLLAQLPDETARRVRVLPYAVGNEHAILRFAITGEASSTGIAADGSDAELTDVLCFPIDQLVDDLGLARPTMLKMDIEGAELDALAGAHRTIAAGETVVAASVYHRQDHLWRIPLIVHETRGDLSMALRPHNEEGWDLVLYAVPPARRP
jgi:FkbM family methyltransferase